MAMISFHNPGLIDISAATLLGVNVKTNDSPIGFFGSGLKFSAATILRLNGSLRIRRGDEVYEFNSRPETIRGEEFHVVYLNDQRLGFTTAMGPNWEPWMVFRELASNAKDEGGGYCFGKYQSGLSVLRGDTETTIIEVEGIDEIWPERNSIFLSSKPTHTFSNLEVHPGLSKYVFYRGIRIHELANPSHFTYNLTGRVDLTEDRTLKSAYILNSIIGNAIAGLEDQSFTHAALYQSAADSFESKLDWDWADCSDLFHTFLQDNGCGWSEQLKIKNRQWKLNQTSELEVIELTALQRSMYDQALAVLTPCGLAPTHPVIFVQALARGVCGMVKNSTAYIASNAFSSTHELAATLYEEEAHLRSQCDDCTRQFQNYLINQILQFAQEKTGKAL